MYQRAFSARKLSEGTPSDSDDIHITIQIGGIKILLAQGAKVKKISENLMCREFNFDNEDDLHKAYDILSKDSLYKSMEGPYPWHQC